MSFAQDNLVLASDRAGGNPATIRVAQWDDPAIEWETRVVELNGDDCRVTGIRFDGDVPVGAGPNEAPNNARPHALGIGGVDSEVDNCHFHNWSAAVNVYPANSRTDVHHCTFEDMAHAGLGYGLHLAQQESTSRENQERIAYNLVRNCRHFVAGGLSWYTAQDNLIESAYDDAHQFEVRHVIEEPEEPAGNAVVRNNELLQTNTRLMAIRGRPTDGVWVEENYAAWDSTPCANPAGWGDECVVLQPHHDAFWNVEFEGNQWGGSPP